MTGWLGASGVADRTLVVFGGLDAQQLVAVVLVVDLEGGVVDVKLVVEQALEVAANEWTMAPTTTSNSMKPTMSASAMISLPRSASAETPCEWPSCPCESV